MNIVTLSKQPHYNRKRVMALPLYPSFSGKTSSPGKSPMTNPRLDDLPIHHTRFVEQQLSMLCQDASFFEQYLCIA